MSNVGSTIDEDKIEALLAMTHTLLAGLDPRPADHDVAVASMLTALAYGSKAGASPAHLCGLFAKLAGDAIRQNPIKLMEAAIQIMKGFPNLVPK